MGSFDGGRQRATSISDGGCAGSGSGQSVGIDARRRWVFRSVGWSRRSGRKTPFARLGVHNPTVAGGRSCSDASSKRPVTSESFQLTSPSSLLAEVNGDAVASRSGCVPEDCTCNNQNKQRQRTEEEEEHDRNYHQDCGECQIVQTDCHEDG
jgi:hypothetical protein